jgi:hypothetical protein
MPNYESSGAENLRADAKVYTGEFDKTPSGKGTDCGGDTTGHKTLSSPGKSGSYSATKKPKGVDTYSDEEV